jgi:hypothetical protein
MFRDLVRAWVWRPGLLDSVQVGTRCGMRVPRRAAEKELVPT